MYYPAEFKIARENRYVKTNRMILLSTVCRPAGHKCNFLPCPFRNCVTCVYVVLRGGMKKKGWGQSMACEKWGSGIIAWDWSGGKCIAKIENLASFVFSSHKLTV
jgi:hypothetical protein